MDDNGKTKGWSIRFWNDHGDRLVFMGIALLLALFLYYLMPDMKAEAKVILIGIAMLCYNKARSAPKAENSAPTDIKKIEIK